jgi:prepilin-type N-terminal cleavage/methylation domain-containing protein
MKTKNFNKNQNLQNSNLKSGFTLVELSIAILIISLVSVGVFKSNDLVDAYRRQKTVKEYTEYLSAFKTFQAKYEYLPGDFPDASRIWSGQLNGDGDGIMDGELNTHYGYLLEGVYAWGHLSKEGLVSGNYPGNPTSKCYDTDGICTGTGGLNITENGIFISQGVHAPVAPVRNYTSVERGRPFWIATADSLAGKFNNTSGIRAGWKILQNHFILSKEFIYRWGGNLNIYRSISCKDISLIDSKVDDFKPFTGNIICGGTYDCRGCVSGVSELTSDPENWNYLAPDLYASDPSNFVNPEDEQVTIPRFYISGSE